MTLKLLIVIGVLLMVLAILQVGLLLLTDAQLSQVQHSIEPGWVITIYLPIDAKDLAPNTTKNILTIGPRHSDREVCRGLLAPLREHYKGARKIDCE